MVIVTYFKKVTVTIFFNMIFHIILLKFWRFYMAKKKEYILVTGGAGYIGSHAVKVLLEHGHDVVVLDNLSTGHAHAVDKRAELVIGDVTNWGVLVRLFKKYNIVGCMHFAGKIVVPESVSNPLAYFTANIEAVNSLLRAMKLFNVKNIVFSSTAAVYGTSDLEVITEDAPLHPESPYGFSKLTAENLIRYSERAYGIKHIIFRYFNVAGAYDTYEIGEAHPVETHIIPVTVNHAISGEQMQIFGNDYNTFDGTCVRDYIHVVDLAEAHALGIEHLLAGGESNTINLGSTNGFSNKQIVETVSKVTGKPVNYTYGPRRAGDPAKIVASNARAKEILHWEPKRDLTKMIESDFNWRQSHPHLYEDQEQLKISASDLEKVVKIKHTKKTDGMLEPLELKDKEHFAKLVKENKVGPFNKVISD